MGAEVAACIAAALERLLDHDIGVRLGEDPEFVHQSRVATRRLRSDLKTFRDALDPVWVDRMRAELKWLGADLGGVRDADVLAARLHGYADQAAEADRKFWGRRRQMNAKTRAGDRGGR